MHLESQLHILYEGTKYEERGKKYVEYSRPVLYRALETLSAPILQHVAPIRIILDLLKPRGILGEIRDSSSTIEDAHLAIKLLFEGLRALKT